MKKKHVTQILFLVVIVVVWQGIYMVGVEGLSLWKAYAMPSPSGVAGSFHRLLADGSLLWPWETVFCEGLSVISFLWFSEGFWGCCCIIFRFFVRISGH